MSDQNSSTTQPRQRGGTVASLLDDDLAARLRESLAVQESEVKKSLILNPVENVPFPEDIAVAAGPLHGLYNSDKVRTRDQRQETVMQFAGRGALEADSTLIYEAWASALHAAGVSLRVLSGLHAHIVLFMALARAGETVLLLPTRAGGHVSGKAILERLGLEVVEMDVDDGSMAIDTSATIARAPDQGYDYVLVDRSEGLVVEDFRALLPLARSKSIFDASQYLSNVIAGDHLNPLDAGFDLLVASVHKNFPGPQKALLATRELDDVWRRTLGEVSTYVSNMHITSTYAAGLTLSRTEWLSNYSRTMLKVAVALEADLAARGVPVVRRRPDRQPTHHIWIREADRAKAFTTFERLEQSRILTNFRLLPYSLGFGLRLGVSAAVRLGMTEDDVPTLGELIAQIRVKGATPSLTDRVQAFSERLWENA